MKYKKRPVKPQLTLCLELYVSLYSDTLSYFLVIKVLRSDMLFWCVYTEWTSRWLILKMEVHCYWTSLYSSMNYFWILICCRMECTLCLKKRPTFTTCCYFYIHISIGTILAEMLPRKQAIKMYFIFPPHLTSASVLPGETGNPEIASFHLNVACFFTNKTRNTV